MESAGGGTDSVEAVSEAFPMVYGSKSYKNTYTMIKDDGFLANDMPSSGKYDDLIDVGVENIHPNYQRAFLDNFSRERLLQMLGQGRKEVASSCIRRDGEIAISGYLHM